MAQSWSHFYITTCDELYTQWQNPTLLQFTVDLGSSQSDSDLIGEVKTQIRTHPEDPVSLTEEAPDMVRGYLRFIRLHGNLKMTWGFHDRKQFLPILTPPYIAHDQSCLLYTSDAADE